MTIAVVDGQGGGIGKSIIERLKSITGNRDEITALGTNALATSVMLKAGASFGATGENAIIVNAARADIITGAMGIVIADSMMGELTEKMAHAISVSNAKKVLIPFVKCGVIVAGVRENLQASDFIEDTVLIIKEILQKT